MAEIQGVGLQTIPSGGSQLIDFGANTKVGDGSILVNGTDIILPETGTYMVCYTTSGAVLGGTTAGAGAGVGTLLRQGGNIVLGSNVGTNFVGGTVALPNDNGQTNCSLVCVSDTVGNNIVQLEVGVLNTTGGATGYQVQRFQTSVTVTKYSDEICSPY
ncbi:hypothetical protein OIN60_21995 [Paenibacillus sp. P96]|uniref:Uncharacterized protein n=1 Tax=Paenibacillus zeirhizosphaerae TaxID=2987519 RepID=A0ABT9FXD8_9BACL|nr:hypothetical protein [Paenibacillus sp. P96]MDP4099393.1 hypothetical protein [Paenibacillus sp. P96]